MGQGTGGDCVRKRECVTTGERFRDGYPLEG